VVKKYDINQCTILMTLAGANRYTVRCALQQFLFAMQALSRFSHMANQTIVHMSLSVGRV
jgi:hypothetical protein